MIDQIDAAIAAHQVWKERLLYAIQNGKADVTPDVVGKDNVCPFGQWLYGNTIPDSEKDRDDYAKVKIWHAAFHKEAGNVLSLVAENKIAEATEAMTAEGCRYYQASSILLELLNEWKNRLSKET